MTENRVTTVNLPKAMLARIDVIARENHIESRSAVIRQALIGGLRIVKPVPIPVKITHQHKRYNHWYYCPRCHRAFAKRQGYATHCQWHEYWDSNETT